MGDINVSRGFKLHYKKLKHWVPLFEEWFLGIERYCRLTDEDAPYWYNERANISVLAGAAWRCGWVALEEFRCEKKKGREKKTGRSDLWMMSDSKTEELVESKFGFLALRSTRFQEFAEGYIDAACRDVKKVDETGTPTGVAFLSPHLPISYEGEMEDKIEKAISKIFSIQHDAIAWCFPRSTRSLSVPKGKRIYPGVILIARRA